MNAVKMLRKLNMNILGVITMSMVVWTALVDEPNCHSRFDYEYKVVQKLVELENVQKDQTKMFKEQVERNEALSTEIENVNISSQRKIYAFENALKEQNEMIKKLKTDVELANNMSMELRKEVDSLRNSYEENKDQVVAFSAALGTLRNIQGGQIIVFNDVILNEAGGYDQGSGIFTCPREGIYLVTLFIGVRDTEQFFASLMVNGTPKIYAVAEGKHSTQDLQGGNSIITQLHKGDRVWVQQATGSGLEAFGNFKTSSFSAVLLYPDV